MADDAQALFGNYASQLNKKYTKSPWDRLKELGKLIRKTKGQSKNNTHLKIREPSVVPCEDGCSLRSDETELLTN